MQQQQCVQSIPPRPSPRTRQAWIPSRGARRTEKDLILQDAVEDYFETALTLRNRINPLARLASKGIKPDFGLYSLKGIKTVIRSGIGATPVIQCSMGPFGKYQLYQIYVCVAGDGKTFIDCPDAPQYTCSDEILFHPFKKWMLKKELKDDEPFVLPGLDMDQ